MNQQNNNKTDRVIHHSVEAKIKNSADVIFTLLDRLCALLVDPDNMLFTNSRENIVISRNEASRNSRAVPYDTQGASYLMLGHSTLNYQKLTYMVIT